VAGTPFTFSVKRTFTALKTRCATAPLDGTPMLGRLLGMEDRNGTYAACLSIHGITFARAFLSMTFCEQDTISIHADMP